MSVINMEAFKELKAKKERALQYAKAYGVDINTVLTEMAEVEATEVTVTRTISRKEAMEALSGTIITPSQLGIDTLDNDIDTSDVKVIQWNPDIPW